MPEVQPRTGDLTRKAGDRRVTGLDEVASPDRVSQVLCLFLALMCRDPPTKPTEKASPCTQEVREVLVSLYLSNAMPRFIPYSRFRGEEIGAQNDWGRENQQGTEMRCPMSGF